MRTPLALLSLTALISIAASAKVGFVSPFPSTVEGVTIPNAHLVAQGKGEVYRGMSPDGKASELRALGITDVLIFKNDNGNELAEELAELQVAGFDSSQVKHIPFMWNKVNSFEESCTHVVEALKALQNSYSTPGKKLYFHCTVGEDRTGLLAGTFRMLTDSLSARAAFDGEMCLNGYSAGDPNKPAHVNQAIDDNLTPLFLKIATLIEQGKLSLGSIDSSVCKSEPAITYNPSDFRCGNSPRYVPLKR